jgi:hypothetical protein
MTTAVRSAVSPPLAEHGNPRIAIYMLEISWQNQGYPWLLPSLGVLELHGSGRLESPLWSPVGGRAAVRAAVRCWAGGSP